MKSIKDILLNHKLPATIGITERNVCAQVVSEVLKTTIKPSQTHYSDRCVSFSVKPVLKAEILLQKEEIIKRIKDHGIQVMLLR